MATNQIISKRLKKYPSKKQRDHTCYFHEAAWLPIISLRTSVVATQQLSSALFPFRMLLLASSFSYISTHCHKPRFFQSFLFHWSPFLSPLMPPALHVPAHTQPFSSFSPSTSIAPAAFQTRSHMHRPQPASLCNPCYSTFSPENTELVKEIS